MGIVLAQLVCWQSVVAVCCSVLQCVAVCCSVLQCVGMLAKCRSNVDDAASTMAMLAMCRSNSTS